jgi:hypothetical protein
MMNAGCFFSACRVLVTENGSCLGLTFCRHMCSAWQLYKNLLIWSIRFCYARRRKCEPLFPWADWSCGLLCCTITLLASFPVACLPAWLLVLPGLQASDLSDHFRFAQCI